MPSASPRPTVSKGSAAPRAGLSSPRRSTSDGTAAATRSADPQRPPARSACRPVLPAAGRRPAGSGIGCAGTGQPPQVAVNTGSGTPTRRYPSPRQRTRDAVAANAAASVGSPPLIGTYIDHHRGPVLRPGEVVRRMTGPRAGPQPSVSQNGCGDTPTPDRSKSNTITWSRSTRNSNPTCMRVVANHHDPEKWRWPLKEPTPRTAATSSNGTFHNCRSSPSTGPSEPRNEALTVPAPQENPRRSSPPPSSPDPRRERQTIMTQIPGTT